MKVIDTAIPEVKIFAPTVHRDTRGFFVESFRASWLGEFNFVQDNHSRSGQGTLRGIHYQLEKPQGKLVRVTAGCVLDVAVDLRKSSPTFRQHVAQRLDDQDMLQLWVPPGFGHGFYVLSEYAEFQYKCTDYYDPADERAILWNDSDLAIDWGAEDTPNLSARDQAAVLFSEAELYD
jgi:dTDP-4-dehydrorhamnose 3,5-epimerase